MKYWSVIEWYEEWKRVRSIGNVGQIRTRSIDGVIEFLIEVKREGSMEGWIECYADVKKERSIIE